MTNLSEWPSEPEAAALLGTSVKTIIRYAAQGKIYYGFQMPETLEHAKGRALSLTAAGKPIEAICVMLHALRGLGVDPLVILDRLHLLRMQNTATHEMTEGVWKWVADLEA